MEQLEFFIVPSPCVGWCQLNQKGYCVGCYRSRQERFEWNQLNDTQKKDIIRLCRHRKIRLLRENEKKIIQTAASDQLSLFK